MFKNYIYIYIIKISGKVDESNAFTSNISFFILGRTSPDKIFMEFFNILAIEEIDKKGECKKV